MCSRGNQTQTHTHELVKPRATGGSEREGEASRRLPPSPKPDAQSSLATRGRTVVIRATLDEEAVPEENLRVAEMLFARLAMRSLTGRSENPATGLPVRSGAEATVGKG